MSDSLRGALEKMVADTTASGVNVIWVSRLEDVLAQHPTEENSLPFLLELAWAQGYQAAQVDAYALYDTTVNPYRVPQDVPEDYSWTG